MSIATKPVADDPDDAADGSSNLIDLDAALTRAIRGDKTKIDAHLIKLERDITIGETLTRLHCYFLPIDAHGRVRFKPLAEFLRDQVIDYAIPRRTIQEAQEQFGLTGSAAPISKLHERAKSLFTDLANTGEGGELLLFAMAEAVFGLTQIICKMSLKTSTSMHYHGSDGVYAEVRADGGLNLYWGESKIYANAATAIQNCLTSLAPFIIEEDGTDAQREQDILLVNEFANFSDEGIIDGLKAFLDRDNSKSHLMRHCGIALTAFDSKAYPNDGAEKTMDDILTSLRGELESWKATVTKSVGDKKLEKFDLHFICVPMPSAAAFRTHFLQLLGVQPNDDRRA